MELFEFEQDFKKLDYRSQFVNSVLKLIIQKHNGNLILATEEAEPFFKYFDELIRNVYELIENEIPLWAHRNLLKYGKDNYDFTDKEYIDAIIKTIAACSIYYK